MITPVFSQSDWACSREKLLACGDLDELRSTLQTCATDMYSQARQACSELGLETNDRRFDPYLWWSLSVGVEQVSMRCSGGHLDSGDARQIFVNEKDHRLRQRFTIAHELAHLLLNKPDGTGLSWLDPKQEEKLCDFFASEFLIPRTQLHGMLHADDRLDPVLLNRLCRTFRVNLHPMLIALEQTPLFDGIVALLSRHRCHPQRTSELDYRIDKQVCASSAVFLPKDRRLRSVGLGDVATRALNQPAGQLMDGCASKIELSLWSKEEGSGLATGMAKWRAQTLGAKGVLVILDTSNLDFSWKNRQK